MAGNSRKASRAVCVHEAAHVFTHWYLGFRVDFAEVYRTPTRPVAPQVAGRMTGERVILELTPEQSGIASVPLREWYRRRGATRAEAALLILAAGPVAEARARHACETYIWALGGGINDYRQALAIARLWLAGEPETLLDIACLRARTLLRSPRATAATTALADVLHDRGWLNGQEIAAICAEAFAGREPAREAWSESWPPTDAQLREAFIPACGNDGVACGASDRRSHEIVARLTSPEHPF